jgi:hypothetical protein
MENPLPCGTLLNQDHKFSQNNVLTRNHDYLHDKLQIFITQYNLGS